MGLTGGLTVSQRLASFPVWPDSLEYASACPSSLGAEPPSWVHCYVDRGGQPRSLYPCAEIGWPLAWLSARTLPSASA